MILTFYVHGRGKDEPEPLSWVKDSWAFVVDQAKEAAKYVGVLEQDAVDEVREKTVEVVEQKKESASGWLGSLFGGFTGLRSGEVGKSTQRGLPPPGTYTSGEVHGDYVKVSLLPSLPAQNSSAERQRNIPAIITDHRCTFIDSILSRSCCGLLVSRGG